MKQRELGSNSVVRKKTAILCCYGHYDKDKRTPDEIKGYEQYLEAAQNFLANCNEEFREISYSGSGALAMIIAGGFTRTDSPISEAESVLKFCSEKAVHYTDRWLMQELTLHDRLFLEEESKITAENIIFSIEHFIVQGFLSSDVVIICDRLRHIKCLVIAWYVQRMFRIEGMKIRVVSFPRPDIHPNSRWHIQFLGAVKMWLMPQTILPSLWKEKGGWKRYLLGL